MLLLSAVEVVLLVRCDGDFGGVLVAVVVVFVYVCVCVCVPANVCMRV